VHGCAFAQSTFGRDAIFAGGLGKLPIFFAAFGVPLRLPRAERFGSDIPDGKNSEMNALQKGNPMNISLATLALIVTASSTTALASWHKEEVMVDRQTVRTELSPAEATAMGVPGGESESKDKMNSLTERKSL